MKNSNIDRRAGKPRSGCDTERLRDLHAQGLCDTAIARAMGKAPKTIRIYREKLGLPRNEFDPRSDNGPKNWDQKRARELYDQGCSDTVISREVGVGLTAIHTWRTRNHLPAHFSGAFNEQEARSFYDAGYSDPQLAARLGVSRTAIRSWREENALEPNLERHQLDVARARELYEAGQNDAEISRALGVSENAVLDWRNKEGLASKFPRLNQGLAYVLWERGLTDAQISAECGVTPAAVRSWRARNGLVAVTKRDQSK